MTLPPRLLAIASMLRHGHALADIGSDHARLCLHALERGCPSALATDVRPGPLRNAREALQPYGGRADTLLCDGLTKVPPCYTDIVIAGMGGESIAAIIVAAPHIRDPQYRLLLQPMTKQSTLRRALYDGGWRIERELLSQEGRRFYNIIQASYGLPSASPPERALERGAQLEPFGGANLDAYHAACDRAEHRARQGRARSRVKLEEGCI